MDSYRFDTLVKHLYVLKSRREGLRVLLAGLVAGALGPPAVTEAAACQGKGAACSKDAECCSNFCAGKTAGRQAGREAQAVQQGVAAERRSKKRKKGRKSKNCKKGKRGRVGQERRQSCKRQEMGRCDCSRTQQRCNERSDCCAENQGCGPIRSDCDPVDEMVCCGRVGATCVNSCDCCLGNTCDVDLGECVEVACLDSGQPCFGSGNCCQTGDICATSALCGQGALQAEVVMTVCCHTSGPCDDDCECCGPVECIDGFCGGPV